MLARLLHVVLALASQAGATAIHDARQGEASPGSLFVNTALSDWLLAPEKKVATPGSSIFLDRDRASVKDPDKGANIAAAAPSITSQNRTDHRESKAKGVAGVLGGWAESVQQLGNPRTSQTRTDQGEPVGKEKHLAPTHAIPGLAIGLLTGVAFLGVLGWKWYSDDEDEEEGSTTLDLDKWRLDADKGQLDFYTCMALHSGRHDFSSTAKRFFPRLVAVLCMQLLLGVLLVMYQAQNKAFYPAATGAIHRTIGVLLYLYSARRLYLSMYDECRHEIEGVMFSKSVSGWYSWPVVFGELMNTGVCITLLFILYLILSDCTKPQYMLINAIAINFVADVDNEFVTDEDAEEAIENLTFANKLWMSSTPRRSSSRVIDLAHVEAEKKESSSSSELQRSMLHLNRVLRGAVPVMIVFLTFVFAFADNDSMCQLLRGVEPWPFCFENSQQH